MLVALSLEMSVKALAEFMTLDLACKIIFSQVRHKMVAKHGHMPLRNPVPVDMQNPTDEEAKALEEWIAFTQGP